MATSYERIKAMGTEEMQTDIKIIETNSANEFKTDVEDLLNKGYKILSTNITVINSEAYDFCSCYQAMMLKEVNNGRKDNN